VRGHRTASLGVEKFGQCGTVSELYRHFGIDAQSIARRALGFTNGGVNA
jgi:pyruvate dehydrogenase E1 component